MNPEGESIKPKDEDEDGSKDIDYDKLKQTKEVEEPRRLGLFRGNQTKILM